MDDKATPNQLDSDLRDRPELQCGEVAVTREMVRAGVDRLLELQEEYPLDYVAEEVFRAMMRASDPSRS